MIIIYAINTYKDLNIEIDIAKMNIDRLKKEKKIYEECLKPPAELKAQNYSDMPKGSKNFTSMDRIIPKINEIDIQLEREELILKGMLEQKTLMNSKLKGLDGFQYKIIYMKDIEGKSGIKIAQELGVNEKTVYRTIAKIKRKNKEKVG